METIENIYAKHRNHIYRLALSITRNEKDAEDVLQNTLIKVMNNIGGFRSQSAISTWIYRITYNEALMHLRKKRRQNRLSEDITRYVKKAPSVTYLHWAKLPDEQLMDKELKERMEGALNRLPLKYRMALVLHNTEDLPLKEIASVLGLKLNSVKTRLHRAYLMMKSEITDYWRDKLEKPDPPIDSSCPAVTRFVKDYALETLSQYQSEGFRRHISSCRGCKAFLDAYLKAIRMTGSIQCKDIPPELHSRIKDFLRQHKKPETLGGIPSSK